MRVEVMVPVSDCNLLCLELHDTLLDNTAGKNPRRMVIYRSPDDQNQRKVDTAEMHQSRSKPQDMHRSSMCTQLASVTEQDLVDRLVTMLVPVMAKEKADRLVS